MLEAHTRKAPRWAPPKPIVIGLLDRPEYYETVDVSHLGIRIRGWGEFDPIAVHALRVEPIGVIDEPICLAGRVVWCQMHTESGRPQPIEAGIQFVEMTEANRDQLQSRIAELQKSIDPEAC